MEGGEDLQPQWQASAAYDLGLAPGDILLQGAWHAAMWVGGAKPVVHAITTSADGAGTTKGVIQQSDSFVRTNAAALRVFRYVADRTLGRRAADFAIKWATESDRNAVPAADALLVDKNPTVRVLKTPYSEKRHLTPVGKPDRQGPWSVDSLFRAVKAMARARDGMGLSPNHGVSCDQFVVYCYQAAVLEANVNGGSLPADLIDRVRRGARVQPELRFDLLHWAKTDDYVGDEKTAIADRDPAGGLWRDRAFAVERKVFGSLKREPERELITAALSGLVDQTARMLPRPLRRDAKTTDIESLIRDLRAPDSGFRDMGRIKASGASLVLEL
jgi:hypothetical protein